MIFFIAAYLLIYGSVHYYFFFRIKNAFPMSPAVNLCLITSLVIMVLAPIIVHWLEHYSLNTAAVIAAVIGYVWMGFLFLFFSSAMFLEVYRLAVHLIGLISPETVQKVILVPRWHFIIALVYAAIAVTYGFFEAKNIQIERISLNSSKIPYEAKPFKIAQISDVHLGITFCKEKLRKIADIVEAEKPDILVSTGDLVNSEGISLDGLSAILAELHPKYGKYAVTGNHEFYAGVDKSVDFTERAGFRMLRNDTALVGDFMAIAGVDDPTARQMSKAEITSEEELLSDLPQGRFRLFLKHQPIVKAESNGLFDLMLSGHTHKGQLFPFNLLTGLFFTYNAGLKQLTDNSYIYVSRGTGTWGPPVRFLAPPEVTIIEIR